MPGRLLTDDEITEEIKNGNLRATGIDAELIQDIHADLSCPVQASSLDLKIGRIMIPPLEIDEAFQNNNEPQKIKSTYLEAGKTCIVETCEEITFGSDLAAFGFPPASLARNAILMTNPGHIDPGFSGRISFTLINMGRGKFYLEEGQQILSLLVFKFDKKVKSDYKDRSGGKLSHRNYLKTLNQLSTDFASFENRMEEKAIDAVASKLADFDKKTHDAAKMLDDAERKFDRSKLWVAALAGVTVAILGLAGAFVGDWILGDKYAKSDSIKNLEQELARLEGKIIRLDGFSNAISFDERVDEMEREVRDLTKQLRGEGK